MVSLHRGLQKPLHGTVKVKLELSWLPQDIRDTRAPGYLLRRAANCKLKQPKRKKCVVVNKAERSCRSEERLTPDMESQSLEYSQLVFSLALVRYFLTVFPFLLGIVMYILGHDMLEVYNLGFFLF